MIAALFLTASVAYFCLSNLSLVPIPWPDGSAFYLPSLDLFQWPPSWKMHAQAAFVPSYDQANFNLMPALPLLLGAFKQLGLMNLIDPPLLIKCVSFLALLYWAWSLWRWQVQGSLVKKSLLIPIFITVSGLWDPTVRWGTGVVRTETWVGLCWLLILQELWRSSSPYTDDFGHPSYQDHQAHQGVHSRSLWKVSGLLALSAYFHFEAIILVPATALCVLPLSSNAPVFSLTFLKTWSKTLIQIGLKTLLFLSPWLIYVILNFSLFLEQMHIQFSRLTVQNSWISNVYLLFHSLFLELGSPTGVPKFFNIAKAIFWILILFLTSELGVQVFSKLNRKKSKDLLSLQIGSAAAFWLSFYLWCVKAEVWFITLCHLTLWTWLTLSCFSLFERLRTQPSLTPFIRMINWATGGFALLSILGTFVQSHRMQPGYQWHLYEEWVSCIDEEIQKMHIDSPKIWQPHVPDVLVELSFRHPQYNLTRTLDFSFLEARAWEFAQTEDAILLTTFFDTPPNDPFSKYRGNLRAKDLAVYPSLPYGEKFLNEFPAQLWTTQICHYGPFWAALISKKIN